MVILLARISRLRSVGDLFICQIDIFVCSQVNELRNRPRKMRRNSEAHRYFGAKVISEQGSSHWDKQQGSVPSNPSRGFSPVISPVIDHQWQMSNDSAAAKNSKESSQRALRKASAASLRDIATYKGWMHKQGKGPPLNLKPEIVFVVSE